MQTFLKGACGMNEERFNRIEDMLGTLIQMVGNTNARVEDLTERVDRLEAKVDKVANDLTDFREEVNGRFDRVEKSCGSWSRRRFYAPQAIGAGTRIELA
jgi:hypothetical protein